MTQNVPPDNVDPGLAMTGRTPGADLEAERACLRDLTTRPWPARAAGYFRLSGPGWVQSALTLGGGSGSTSLFAGALAAYTLLWVQPTSMALGAIIITMMLVSGFTLREMCGGKPGGAAYRIGIAIPALGLFGPLVFGKLQMWLMVPISVFCFFFIPIAYVTFFILMNSRRFLGDDRPRGLSRWAWNAGMILAICVVTGGGAYKIVDLLSSQ